MIQEADPQTPKGRIQGWYSSLHEHPIQYMPYTKMARHLDDLVLVLLITTLMASCTLMVSMWFWSELVFPAETTTARTIWALGLICGLLIGSEICALVTVNKINRERRAEGRIKHLQLTAKGKVVTKCLVVLIAVAMLGCVILSW